VRREPELFVAQMHISMTISRAWLSLALVFVAASATAEPGVVTLVEGGARLLRGATWYKLVVGTRVEEADIIEASDRAQAQVELAAGSRINLVGPGAIYLVPSSPKAASGVLAMPMGWLKLAAEPPGIRIRTPLFDCVVGDGVLVVHATGNAVEFFGESGSAKLIELAANGTDGAARDVKSGEFASKSVASALAVGQRAPKSFIDAMPRHFADPLPALAERIKARPALGVDHEITYAEAEPWLAGRDRAAFEKRFAARLRDPAFRSAALPNIARYPMWDRMLNPEKYAPKGEPAK
jgi:hypothetical protein